MMSGSDSGWTDATPPQRGRGQEPGLDLCGHLGSRGRWGSAGGPGVGGASWGCKQLAFQGAPGLGLGCEASSGVRSSRGPALVGRSLRDRWGTRPSREDGLGLSPSPSRQGRMHSSLLRPGPHSGCRWAWTLPSVPREGSLGVSVVSCFSSLLLLTTEDRAESPDPHVLAGSPPGKAGRSRRRECHPS